jgi:formamidase
VVHAGGFLTDHFPAASKAIWNFDGLYCESRHIPGVRFPGLIHPGLIGTAPSKELLDIWNTREKALVDAGGETGEKATTLCGCLHTRPLACLPEEKGACLGKVDKASPAWSKVGCRVSGCRVSGVGCRVSGVVSRVRLFSYGFACVDDKKYFGYSNPRHRPES